MESPFEIPQEKGKELKDVEEGDIILFHTYGNILKIASIEKSFEEYVIVKGARFKRDTGQQPRRNDYIWIIQYDPAVYLGYLKNKRYVMQKNVLRSMDWSQLNEDQLNEVYEYLKGKNFIE